MIEIKKLSGVLNLDSREMDVLQNQHVQALNIRFYGTPSGMVAENVPGTDEIINSQLPVGPVGTNECIGGLFDQVHNAIFWFNWNANNQHGIYMYDVAAGTISPLIINFIDSQTDILHFQRDYPVSNPLILYTTAVDGDILFWTIRNQRPKCLNIKQAIDNLYGANWLEEYLDVAKNWLYIPPLVAYEDDSTNTVNNLRKKLFLAQGRYWFRDNEKSTYGSKSEIPIPFQYTDPQIDTDPTKNCRIAIAIQTGDASVTKIEIVMFESLGNVFSKAFSVVILDKQLLGIPDNDTYIYRFYNNEAYDFVDLDEQLLDFSRVPDTANDQALINGNVIAYGGITEGKDPVVPNVTIDVSFEYPLMVTSNTAFSVTQYGTNGFQTDKQIKFVFIGLPRMNDTPSARIQIGGSFFTISYTIQVGDTTTDVINGLATNATGQGFAVVSQNANELVIYQANQRLLFYSLSGNNQSIIASFVLSPTPSHEITILNGAQYLPLFSEGVKFFFPTLAGTYTVISATVVGLDLFIIVAEVPPSVSVTTTLVFIDPLNNSIPVDNASSKYNWGLVYYDEKGKSNGVNTVPGFNVITDPLNISLVSGIALIQTPNVTARISHRPPLWARSYQWVRSANLSKESFLYWVSDRTYKDDKFAYISIESINAFKKINESISTTTGDVTKRVSVSYEFSAGDRIKFYIRYSPAAIPVVSYGNEHDYEIIAQVVNPDINGSTRTGTFLKIILPDIDANFNFGTGLSLDYYFYYIELYTPAKSASEGLGVYYEWGQQFGIGNPGTTLAFHQGMTQNQSTNLATPAVFFFDKGDDWYRTRVISIGNVILYDILSGYFLIGGPIPSVPKDTILGQHLTVEAYTTNDYQVAQDVSVATFLPNYNFPNWTLNVVGLNAYAFRVRGAVNVSIVNIAGPAGTLVDVSLVITTVSSTGTVIDNTLQNITGVAEGQDINYDFDTNISIAPNTKSFLHLKLINVINPATYVTANLISGYLSYTEPQKDFTVGVIDQNFSDFFESKVNSNGREWTVNPDEKTNFFNTLIRYGGQYQQNTNINQVNIFYPNDFVEAYRSWGDIQRLIVRGTQLLVFQERKVGFFGIYGNYIRTSDNDTQLTTVNTILTQTNIQYYEGEYGLGKQYTSVISSQRAIYFADPVRGEFLRLSGDGIISLSILYYGQFTIRNWIVDYNKTLTRTFGGSAKILGVFDAFNDEAHFILQGGQSLKGRFVEPHNLSFNETRNGFSSEFSWNPDLVICAEDTMYSWKNGKLYVHNSDTYCNFYDQDYPCSITLVFNKDLSEVKTWESVWELASEAWSCPTIYSNVNSFQGQRQESELIKSDLKEYEGVFKSAFFRDIHSIAGLLNGDFLKGSYLVIKFNIENASNVVTLTEVTVKSIDSPLTAK